MLKMVVKMENKNEKRKYKHMRAYCLACGKVIKEGENAYLLRGDYEKEEHKQKYMIICTECYERLDIKEGKKIIFGKKKETK